MSRRTRRTTPPLIRSTRKERGRQNSRAEETAPKKQFWVQIRILPIWLRVILVLLLLAGAAILGALIGYGYIGDGDPSDVLKKKRGLIFWISLMGKSRKDSFILIDEKYINKILGGWPC